MKQILNNQAPKKMDAKHISQVSKESMANKGLDVFAEELEKAKKRPDSERSVYEELTSKEKYDRCWAKGKAKGREYQRALDLKILKTKFADKPWLQEVLKVMPGYLDSQKIEKAKEKALKSAAQAEKMAARYKEIMAEQEANQKALDELIK